MKIVVLSLGIFAISFVGMAIGVLLRRRSLRPCSRFASTDGDDVSCQLCSQFGDGCEVAVPSSQRSEGETS